MRKSQLSREGWLLHVQRAVKFLLRKSCGYATPMLRQEMTYNENVMFPQVA